LQNRPRDRTENYYQVEEKQITIIKSTPLASGATVVCTAGGLDFATEEEALRWHTLLVGTG
jgi:hypothetical protein